MIAREPAAQLSALRAEALNDIRRFLRLISGQAALLIPELCESINKAERLQAKRTQVSGGGCKATAIACIAVAISIDLHDSFCSFCIRDLQ